MVKVCWKQKVLAANLVPENNGMKGFRTDKLPCLFLKVYSIPSFQICLEFWINLGVPQILLILAQCEH